MTIRLNGRDVQADGSGNLYKLMTGMGLRLNAPCGGGGRCGKCRVRIANPEQPTAADMRLISHEDLAQGVRLACATEVYDGMDVAFEQANERAAHIATEGRSVRYPFSPAIQSWQVELAQPSLSDQASDLDRLAAAMNAEKLTAAREALRKLPGALRQGAWKVSAALMSSRLLDVNPERLLGAAVDIGTTTLACYLMDLATGEELAVSSALNPQKAWGDDVITRADAARAGKLDDLQASVAAEIDALIGRMCGNAGVSKSDIYHVTLAGNTVMMHLFAGIPPENIALSPFIPAFTSCLDFPASSLGLRLNPSAVATLLPCVAGYIGADTVAGLLAVGMSEGSEASLLIDIGTNGEIALAAGGRLYACSTAAGPAFEGAHISAGMGGVTGAINKATVAGGIRFTTIGNEPARGICGSGLLDLVAGLVEAGAIDDTGRIDEDTAPNWLKLDDGRVPVDHAAGIYLTGRDVREVQLAKGAIAAGIEVLAAEAGITVSDIRHVWLAGGFGSYMDIRSAARIGLIPPALAERTRAVGNSSGAGAKAALLSCAAMAEAERLARAIRYVELSARKDFQDAFVEKMFF